MQYKYQYQYLKNVLKYNLSTSTSTKYNKTARQTRKHIASKKGGLLDVSRFKINIINAA